MVGTQGCGSAMLLVRSLGSSLDPTECYNPNRCRRRGLPSLYWCNCLSAEIESRRSRHDPTCNYRGRIALS